MCKGGGDCGRRFESGGHRVEDSTKPVTGVFEHGSIRSVDDAPDDLVVACKRHAHTVRIGLPQLRAPLDVGEHEGDDTTREGHRRDVT